MRVAIRAVFWDFGGVLVDGPFDAFGRYELEHGLPADFLRSVNAVDPDTNAWARIERHEISLDEFDTAFADESERLGHRVPGAEVLARLAGEVRPEMVRALDRVVAAGYITACLTNNVMSEPPPEIAAILGRFDHVIESSKVGCRKPEPVFYQKARGLAGVEPDEVVFLDDLGINLKPARAMGMTTIKVVTPRQAITDLEAVLA